jgi:hypothetical protein
MLEMTWDNYEQFESSEFKDPSFENMCAKTKASDYYFYVDDSQPWIYLGKTYIYICLTPIAYFKRRGCMFDCSMYLDHILPDDFSESMESTWECPRSLEDIKQDLLSRGFVDNEEFNAFMKVNP